jgi:hypothetical protein
LLSWLLRLHSHAPAAAAISRSNAALTYLSGRRGGLGSVGGFAVVRSGGAVVSSFASHPGTHGGSESSSTSYDLPSTIDPAAVHRGSGRRICTDAGISGD